MTHITCRLTAKNRDQLRNPTLSDRVWATFTFYLFCIVQVAGGHDAIAGLDIPGRPCRGGILPVAAAVSAGLLSRLTVLVHVIHDALPAHGGMLHPCLSVLRHVRTRDV